jgi:hypothetical protein
MMHGMWLLRLDKGRCINKRLFEVIQVGLRQFIFDANSVVI